MYADDFEYTSLILYALGLNRVNMLIEVLLKIGFNVLDILFYNIWLILLVAIL